ncbi:MAG: hypothetical protein HPAVJP_3530 [Candidatus Hepatoplasma vulgare]|nr:MAG: hypothetical protein HPAVJP_3530 [Candidatus Hepatoplasma sp.]
MAEKSKARKKITSKSSEKNFWQNQKFWLIFYIFLFVFGVFFFTSLGSYTKRDVGPNNIFQASAMGETFFAAGSTDWFLIANNSFIVLMLITPIVSFVWIKLKQKRELNIENLKILRNGYFLIFAFTIVIFAFESISLIAFANNYLSIEVNLQNQTISLLNRKTADTIFAGIYFLGVILLFVGTIFCIFKYKKIKKFDAYESVFRFTAVILLGITMLQLMLAAFGAGALGLNSAFYNINVIDVQGNSSNFMDWYNQVPPVFIPNGLENLISQLQDMVGNKGSFWGVNNNWAGYIIFSLLIIGILYAIYFLFKNIIKIKKNTYKEDKNLFEAFVVLTVIVFAFYFIDRYIVVFIDHGNWNPNLFNGLIIKTFANDYYGTVYFWIMFVLLPLISIGAALLVYKPSRELIEDKFEFLEEEIKEGYQENFPHPFHHQNKSLNSKNKEKSPDKTKEKNS